MTLSLLRDQFNSALLREPEHVQRLGKKIAKNMDIILSKRICDEDKAGAKSALVSNIDRFMPLIKSAHKTAE